MILRLGTEWSAQRDFIAGSVVELQAVLVSASGDRTDGRTDCCCGRE